MRTSCGSGVARPRLVVTNFKSPSFGNGAERFTMKWPNLERTLLAARSGPTIVESSLSRVVRKW